MSADQTDRTDDNDPDDARFYLAASRELDAGRCNEALWAKAQALADGDGRTARYRYIRLRAEQFKRVGRRDRAGDPPVVPARRGSWMRWIRERLGWRRI